ncbi:MAG: nucleotide sugar dehydrogenase [Verrucomicrobia bacterium]|nr:nucleotide sugar dehydrogenase [Verrucomicrobiota bacterium]
MFCGSSKRRRGRRSHNQATGRRFNFMIGFAGLSHLGINYSLATTAKGFDVVAFHPSEELVTDLGKGKFPIEEPGLAELFAANQHRIHFTADAKDLSACDLVFVALDIKTDDNNCSDTGPLTQLIQQIAPHLKKGSSLVLLSQVNPGFTRKLREELLRTSAVGEVIYQVETLIFGRAVERTLHPERYMVGANDSAQPLPPLLKQWHDSFGCPVLVMRYESAELAKIAINFFLVSSVSTTNTLAEVCENIGADWNEIAPALRLDARIGPKAYLMPGLGIAGGNLERDLVTVKCLAEGSQADTGIVDAWQCNSAHRKDWGARTLRDAAKKRGLDLKNAVVAVWGLAYKENTHSIKNSPALQFVAAIPESRKQAYDPAAKLPADAYPQFQQVASALDCCQGADALVIPTPWPEFRAVDLKAIRAAMRGNIILDPFGLLDGAQAVALGFDYYRLGVPPRNGAPVSDPART